MTEISELIARIERKASCPLCGRHVGEGFVMEFAVRTPYLHVQASCRCRLYLNFKVDYVRLKADDSLVANWIKPEPNGWAVSQEEVEKVHQFLEGWSGSLSDLITLKP